MKLRLGKSADTYIKIIRKSLKTSWNHKELWIFALAAGFINTGAIFANAVSSVLRLEPAGKLNPELLETNLESVPVFATWVIKLISLNSNQLNLIIILTVLILIGFSIIVLSSQQFLLFGINRASKRKKHLTLTELSKEVKHLHVLRLFAVNALIFLSLTTVITAASIPLSLLLTEAENFYNIIVYIAFYFVLFPLSFVINIVGIFSIINIVRRDNGILDSFWHSLKALRQNWLVLFEMSLFVFLLDLLILIIFMLTIALVALPFTGLLVLSLETGTTLLLTILGSLGGIFSILFTGAVFGFTVMFNYAVWFELSDRIDKSGIMPIMEKIAPSFKKRGEKNK